MKPSISVACMLFLVHFSYYISGQQEVQFLVSADTVAVGSTIEIVWVAKNLKGHFDGLNTTEFPIKSGPHSSRSISIVNGKTSSEQRASYILEARDTGILTIPSTYFYSSEGTVEVPKYEILVLPDFMRPKNGQLKEVFSIGLGNDPSTKKISLKKKKRRLR